MMKRNFNFFAFVVMGLLFFGNSVFAESAKVLDVKVDEAIEKFVKEVKGGEKFLSKAKAYLVFPAVVKGGLIIGGEYGEGALRIDGKTAHYYSMSSGSVGLQIGLQKRSVLIAFVSETALDGFIHSNGWEAGVDGSVIFADMGAAKDLSSISYEKPIYGFIFNSAGLMANLTLEGTKFTRIIPK